MTTIIDELVVQFGIDHKKFDQGSREVQESFHNLLQESDRATKTVERNTKGLGDVFSLVRKGAVGLMGAFIGGEAAAFVNHMVNMDAATGRFARTIGTGVENLSTWQYMVKQIGGEAGEATAALSAMQHELNQINFANKMPSGALVSLSNLAGINLRTDNPDTVYRKAQAYLEKEIAAGRRTPGNAASFLKEALPGISDNMIFVMLDDFKKLEDAAKKTGTATAETAKAAADLQAKFSLLTQAIERFAAKLIPVIDYLFKPTGEIADDAKKAGWKGIFKSVDDSMGKVEPGSPIDRFNRWVWGPADSAAVSNRAGGSRGDRNNNPGNMEYGDFARRHGAIGSDGRFAIFPDRATGERAQEALVAGAGYHGLTLEQFAKRYAEGAPAWQKTVGDALGIGPGDVVDNHDPRLIAAIRRAEGTGAKSAASARSSVNNSKTSTSSTEININKVELPNVKDSATFAKELPTIGRQSMLIPTNTSLV